MIQAPQNLQSKYLEEFVRNYNQRTNTSKQIAQKFRPYLADNKAPEFFYPPLKELAYTLVCKRSLGSKLWDVDGNEYIDTIMGYGINLFGHNPPFVRQAIDEQLDLGIHLGIQSEIVGEVAELICELTQMERVAFSNTGTEAVMAAIRLARTATNRNKIALFSGSYHGHSDGTLVKAQIVDDTLHTVPKAAGVSPNIAKDVLVLEYGNSRSLDLIKDQESELAAVLVEPVQSRNPSLQPQEFLQNLRQLTKKAGIVLIFDEMVTGFRIHPGGAQAWFGIEADLATYGKIVGGGMPIGVIAGKAAYMDAIDGGMWNYGDTSYPQTEKTFFAGTHCKHPLAMAAARAVLKYLNSHGFSLQQQLNQRTTQFAEALNDYFKEDGLPIQLNHFGSLFEFTISDFASSKDSNSPDIAIILLYYSLLYQGILLHGNSGFLSTAHTDEDLDHLIKAVKNSTRELREAGFFV